MHIGYIFFATLFLTAAQPAFAWDSDSSDMSIDSFASPVISNEELNSYRGMAGFTQNVGEMIVSSMNNTANVSGNIISGTTISGNNAINSGAFNDSSGINIVIQNSGALSTIQTNTLVNLYLQ